MHILAMEKYPSSQRGGQELSLLDICRGLAQNHTITLLHAHRGNLLSQYQTFCQQILHVPSFGFSRENLWKTPIQLPRDLLQAGVQLQSPSLLYCNQIYDIPAPALLARLTRTPLVCHLRLPPPQTLDRLRQSSLRHVDRFITVSHHTRQQWIDFGIPATKITAIHNGVDPERFTPSPDPEALRQAWKLPTAAKVILYTGRLDRRKGVEILLAALAQLRDRHPHLHLLIAGQALLDGPSYQTTLNQTVIDLGLTQIVHFLGHIPDPSSVYRAADLTISPSLWAEPFGKVIIESMACGTPVVASQIGGIPEILTGPFATGLCPPNDAQALAATINRLLNWRQTHPHLGPAARAHIVQHFALPSIIQQVESELLQVFQSAPVSRRNATQATIQPIADAP